MKRKIWFHFIMGPAACFLLLFLFLFRGFLDGSAVLMTTDAAVSNSQQTGIQTLVETYSNWNDGVLLGNPRGAAVQVASLLKGILAGVVWNNWVYGIACLAGSLLFFIGFRKKLNRWAIACGALTAFWLGSNFTLLYPGHTFKPYVVLFFVCSIFSLNRLSWRSAVLWGVSVGLMFVQQPDVALFFALFSGAYYIFRLWRNDGFSPIRWAPVLLLALAMTLLFASGPLLSGYKHQVKNTTQVQEKSPQEKWDYVTQWSWPPEETIAFVAPGYTGWRTGETEGPYWGRMGRSAGWEHSRQGYMNFKMENTYLGVIPVVFALFAITCCRRSKHRAEIIFWSGATLLALLLAFGKYFPLYSIFFKLPIVNNIRNPNKFLQVFQVGLAILSAYGVDALFRSKEPKSIRNFFWVLAGVSGILALYALSVSMRQATEVSGFIAKGWPPGAAGTIVSNKVNALWHAVFMAILVAGSFSIFSFPRFGNILRFKSWVFAGLILIVAVDAAKLSKHYIKKMPRSYIGANALTDFLKKDLGHQRVALLTQESVYNIWLTYLLPYNEIPTFNYAQMPRMAEDYKNFLTAGSKNPLRMWHFAGVKYLLGPTAFEKQLPTDQVRKVFAYDLASAANGEFRVIPRPNGTHAVFEFINPVARYTAVARQNPSADQPVGTVAVNNYRPGRVELTVQADQPCLLRAAERWDSDWKAQVDGESVDIQRIEIICQGIPVPAGSHNVILAYSPSRTYFYMQCAGFLLLLIALISKPWKKHEND